VSVRLWARIAPRLATMRSTASRNWANLAGVAGVSLLMAAVAAAGGASGDFRSDWYARLRKPSWQPPGAVIGAVWSVLYTLTAVSGSLLWVRRRDSRARSLMSLFLIQAVLNVAFTPLLTRARSPELAAADSAALGLTVTALTARAWPVRRSAAVLLLPYVAWTGFATFLSYRIVALNRGRH
jgi:translocator protein